MRIKRVEIIGFKSFCDRAVVQIGESITGVVGPNGCGKSNIVDAIRWCMGEQSAKHLRGKAMEDVIFAGSESRGPAPMAEVSLTFDDVGFSHETLEMARHSDEAETERVLEALAPEADVPAAVGDVPAPAGAPVDVPAAVGDVPAPAGAPVPAPAADAPAPQLWVDAEGNPIPSPTEEATRVLADQPSAFDFGHYTEVTITRRLYRDGLSQYFINKTPCRLRDITDFFLGTGVGTKAYAIIEQGRIGQIVSARPQDRRAIIEEAAGITKFKAKKKAAEKKLEQTRQNLMRVSDIVAELDKRMGTLRRQAQKAERYRKYKAEVRDIELWKASHRWLELSGEHALVGDRLADALGRLEVAGSRESLGHARRPRRNAGHRPTRLRIDELRVHVLRAAEDDELHEGTSAHGADDARLAGLPFRSTRIPNLRLHGTLPYDAPALPTLRRIRSSTYRTPLPL
jgi:chromosome segregation protein